MKDEELLIFDEIRRYMLILHSSFFIINLFVLYYLSRKLGLANHLLAYEDVTLHGRDASTDRRQQLDAEDKRKPLTDEELASILKEKGYVIARRTVAKYREQLGLPVARLRKEI